MPDFIVSLTRDISQDGYLAIEAENEAAAEQKYPVIAALRYWQRCGEFAGQDTLDIATNSGEFEDLNSAELDDLCVQLNCQESPRPLSSS